MSIISVKDMCLWYGDHQALKNVNIEIPEKSITALIGPSGCGKSTFLKTLNRMNDLIPGVKITGDIRYEGTDIFSKEVDVNNLRKEIGMVFQKPNGSCNHRDGDGERRCLCQKGCGSRAESDSQGRHRG